MGEEGQGVAQSQQEPHLHRHSIARMKPHRCRIRAQSSSTSCIGLNPFPTNIADLSNNLSRSFTSRALTCVDVEFDQDQH